MEERSKRVCAINLVEELLESHSSLDEEHGIYALLGQRSYIPCVKCFVEREHYKFIFRE